VATGPVICDRRIESGKIVFCSLHENAQRLLAACSYAREYLTTVKLSEEDGNLVREVVLPYLDNVIGNANPTRSR
jgi:hypothetical protein